MEEQKPAKNQEELTLPMVPMPAKVIPSQSTAFMVSFK